MTAGELEKKVVALEQKVEALERVVEQLGASLKFAANTVVQGVAACRSTS